MTTRIPPKSLDTGQKAWELYKLIVSLTPEEQRLIFDTSTDLKVVAGRCLAVSSNPQNQVLSYPVSLQPKKK